jgi:predicted dehydrogenase
MQKIRWGIMSTGSIAKTVSEDIQRLPDAEIVAVGSRSQASADRFGDMFNIPNRHATYEAFVNDPEIDVIYIATPHGFHYENLQLALNAGKHVLCEKAFTLDANQAREMVALAREKNVFLMEAMWMRFNPAIQEIKRLIDEGTIGDVRYLRAEFNIGFEYDPKHRLFDPVLGGGAMLDLGIYPLSFAEVMLGMPNNIIASTHLGQTGVDENSTYLFEYNNGARAILASSSQAGSPQSAIIAGKKGYIRLLEEFFHPSEFILQIDDEQPRKVSMPIEGNGYTYELREVHECLRAGKTESDIMTLDKTIAMMELMDSIRQQWGMKYPHEA